MLCSDHLGLCLQNGAPSDPFRHSASLAGAGMNISLRSCLVLGKVTSKSEPDIRTHMPSVWNTHHCLQGSAPQKAFFSEPLLGNTQHKCLLPGTSWHWSREVFANLRAPWIFNTSPGQKSQLALEAALCPLHRSSGNPANCLLTEEEPVSVHKIEIQTSQTITTIREGTHRMIAFVILYGHGAFSWSWSNAVPSNLSPLTWCEMWRVGQVRKGDGGHCFSSYAFHSTLHLPPQSTWSSLIFRAAQRQKPAGPHRGLACSRHCARLAPLCVQQKHRSQRVL